MPESRDPKRARKPAAKKPAARKTAAKKATAKKTTAKKTTAKKATAKKATAKKATARKAVAAKKPAARKPAARSSRAADPRDELLDEPAGTASRERSRLARPVAIAGAQTSGEGPSGPSQPPAVFAGEDDRGDDTLPPSPFEEPAPTGAPPGGAGGAPVIDDPRGELLVGLAAAVLAVSVFLPWYESRSFTATSLSGWASGTWGPLVFFLALGAFAIVALRRVGFALAFPVSHALVLEGVGWISVIGLILKRLFTPSGFAIAGFTDGGYWLAIGAGVAVALLGGRLSKDAPFVTVPGWFASAAGKAGATLLAVSLVGGIGFGLMNDFGTNSRPAGSSSFGEAPQPERGLPACVSDLGFPVPDGVEPEQGFGREEPEKICTAIFTSKLTVKQLDKAYRAALKAGGWSFQVVDTPTGGGNNARIYAISAPECATFQILNTQQTRSISVVFGPSFCRGAAQLSPGSRSN